MALLTTAEKSVTFIISIFIFLTACKEKKEINNPRSQAIQETIVDVIIASPRTINNRVEANGSIVANESVELHPEISGRITYLSVPEGTNIQQGTLIARINDADLQATLEKAKVQLDLYQKTEERDRKLLAINGLNQSDYDLALNNVNSTKADISYTQAQIDKTVIRAPFSGTVGLRQVSPGAFVTPSTIIATLQQLDKVKVDFTLPELYTHIIQKGSVIDVEIDATNKIHRKAVILASEAQINQTSRNLKVRALLQEGKGHPGTFAKVYINASVDKKAIMVPTNSIIPDDKNNQLILVKGGKAAFVNVETGVREANDVEITKGVNIGDTVVVTGVLFARPKSALKIRSIKSIEQSTANQ